MIPRNEGEGLHEYLKRLEVIACEREDILTALERLTVRLATASLAHDQLARYTALITADMAGEIRFMPNPEIEVKTNLASSSVQSEGTRSASDTHYISDAERVRTWALAQHGEFDAAQAASELDILPASASRYLSALIAAALLNRVEGTGRPGTPSRYRHPWDTVASAPSGDVEPKPAETQTPPLNLEPEQEEAQLHVDRDRLPLDQRLLLEHLEKQGAMSPKLAASQLNWANSRIDRASSALLSGGLLGWRGPTLVAIPAELLTDLPAAD